MTNLNAYPGWSIASNSNCKRKYLGLHCTIATEKIERRISLTTARKEAQVGCCVVPVFSRRVGVAHPPLVRFQIPGR